MYIILCVQMAQNNFRYLMDLSDLLFVNRIFIIIKITISDYYKV